MKEFIKPEIEIIKVDDNGIILCSGTGGYGPDIPVIDDPDIW